MVSVETPEGLGQRIESQCLTSSLLLFPLLCYRCYTTPGSSVCPQTTWAWTLRWCSTVLCHLGWEVILKAQSHYRQTHNLTRVLLCIGLEGGTPTQRKETQKKNVTKCKHVQTDRQALPPKYLSILAVKFKEGMSTCLTCQAC